MGSVGDFIFGGSQGSQQGQQASQSAYGSQNSSQNQSVQGSSSVASNQTSSGSQSANRAYAPIAQSMSPALGYVTNAGNMMAQLLGLPTTPTSHTNVSASSGTPMGSPILPGVASSPLPTSSLPTTTASVKSSMPTAPAATPSSGTSSLLQSLSGATQSNPNLPSSATIPNNVNGSGYNGYVPPNMNVQYRAFGGPVTPGQPYVVGENQPELFVPHQPGTIIPQVPGGGMQMPLGPRGSRFGGPPGVTPPPPVPGTPAPTPAPAPTAAPANNAGSALNTFANSAGEQFILNQGQQALSGASAANGVFDSGATGKALVQYGQGLGSQYLNQYMQNLGQYAGLGLGAAGAMTGAGGVSQSQSQGSGTSVGSSFGSSTGSSQGTSAGGSTSSGTSSGSDSSKKGLL